jgi:proteasome lid subunit RPN8/RPN11
MSVPPRVVFGPAVLEDIGREAARAYPEEGCGALLGEPGQVRAALPIPNTEKGTPRVRFEVSPKDYLRVEREADARGLKLLGFWHSHPDHPAQPSATDRAYAWEGLLTVIVSVQKGRATDIGAWEIRGAGSPFESVEIASPGAEGALVSSLSKEGES